MSDWKGLLEAAGTSITDIKSRLPLEWVVSEAGVNLEARTDGRLVGVCPFHLDESPSFAIFGENLERVGCWSCDFTNGDVIDFIQRWQSCSFREALNEAIRLLQEFESHEKDEWRPSEPPQTRHVPPEELAVYARTAYTTALDDKQAIVRLLMHKGIDPLAADWLHSDWMVGVEDDVRVLMPHLIRDEKGDLKVTGYKTRTATTHPYAAQGSKFTDLYGSWRDRGYNQVILCEGESDTWKTAWQFPEADVFGLPAGANQVPKAEWVSRFRDREVTILFDADTPGRKAAMRWHDALLKIASSVRIASVEDGADACSTSDLVGAVRDATEVPLWTGQVDLSQAGTHYVRTASGQPVCNWAIIPERLINLDEDGGSAVEGVLVGTKKKVIITSEDASGEASIRRWSLRYDRVWLGSTKDAQSLWEYLLRSGPFLARGHGTRVAGFHDGHFVLPDTTIGPKHWVYVTPLTDPGMERLTKPTYSKDGGVETLMSLLTLHRPEVISPLVAWTAAAPLRSLCNVFPPFAVVGAAGTGKTTIISEVLKVFGWNGHEHNLTSTTPHGVAVMTSATNGVPVWFDEYRRGARYDTREAFNQALRDAWTASDAVRGGLRTNLSSLSVFTAQSPILVSGEDAFSETSHAERMVIVSVPNHGRGIDSLRELRERKANIGRLYLRWLVDRATEGTLPEPYIPEDDRPTQANAVLNYGWELLRDFCMDVWATEIPDLDLTLIEQERADILRVPPIMDAVNWALTELDRSGKPLAWVHDDDVYVRVRALCSQIRKDDVVDLPGGERAVTSWLRQEFSLKQERTNFGMAARLLGARERIENLHLEGEE